MALSTSMSSGEARSPAARLPRSKQSETLGSRGRSLFAVTNHASPEQVVAEPSADDLRLSRAPCALTCAIQIADCGAIHPSKSFRLARRSDGRSSSNRPIGRFSRPAQIC